MYRKLISSGFMSMFIILLSMTLSAYPRGKCKKHMATPPELRWATYFGGTDSEAGEALAVAPDGTVVIAGFTMTFVPAFDINAFIARFSPDGTTLLDVMYLDGASIDGAFGVGVDREGIVTVVGQTMSPDFPVTPDAIQGEYKGGGGDGFVVQLSPEFDILYATYFGGSGEDAITDLAMDRRGGFALCGYTGSEDLLVTDGALQGSYAGGALDAFVVRFENDDDGPPVLSYSTFLGGSGDDSDFDPDDPYGRSLDERLLRQAVALTPSNNIVVAGMTWSEDFPVTPGAWQTEHSEFTDTYEENADIYLTVLNPRAVGRPHCSQLVYSTLIGGSQRDVAEDIVMGSCATVGLVGLSRSPDFPVTPRAHQDTLNGSQDAIVMEILPRPRVPRQWQILYSTYYGGSERDAANGVCRTRSGGLVIGGVTTSGDFPTTDGTTLQGPTDLFLFRLDAFRRSSKQVPLSTLIGGSSGDPLMVGPVGYGSDVFFSGDTQSADFPGVTGSSQETYGGGIWDAILGRFHLGAPGHSHDD